MANARQRGLDRNKKEHDYEKRRSLQSKRPRQKDGESLKAYKARLDRWASKHDIGKRAWNWLSGGGKSKNTRTQFPSNAKGNERLRPADKKAAPTQNKATPTPTKPETTSKPSTTVTSKPQSPNPVPRKQPQSKDMDANYKAWAKANPKLAEKLLEKGDKKQAGYKAVKNAANLKIKGTRKWGENQDQFLSRVLKSPNKKTWLQKNFKP